MHNRLKNGGRKTRTRCLRSIVRQEHAPVQVHHLLRKIMRNHHPLHNSVLFSKHQNRVRVLPFRTKTCDLARRGKVCGLKIVVRSAAL